MFRMTFLDSVTTPIPPDVEADSVISLLHDHRFLIELSPIVTRHELRDRDPETGWLVYDVWEIVNFLPFGLWKKEITFTVSFRDKTDGMVSYVDTTAGLKSEANYTVKTDEHEDGEGSGLVIDEQIESSCNFLLKWIVQSNMLPVRKKMHEQFIEAARRRQKNDEGSRQSSPS